MFSRDNMADTRRLLARASPTRGGDRSEAERKLAAEAKRRQAAEGQLRNAALHAVANDVAQPMQNVLGAAWGCTKGTLRGTKHEDTLKRATRMLAAKEVFVSSSEQYLKNLEGALQPAAGADGQMRAALSRAAVGAAEVSAQRARIEAARRTLAAPLKCIPRTPQAGPQRAPAASASSAPLQAPERVVVPPPP
eukprot:TRINITY_DN59900_c0_g1_i1.p2 TRINITY_DN59900_c0_g1~~TRINITY_DN59900_c0_g1_i1.p2  ORF type:complete len:224 (+),score=66.81 TRINITY_DN59900_c0_g1_i1:95-673(+)